MVPSGYLLYLLLVIKVRFLFTPFFIALHQHHLVSNCSLRILHHRHLIYLQAMLVQTKKWCLQLFLLLNGLNVLLVWLLVLAVKFVHFLRSKSAQKLQMRHIHSHDELNQRSDSLQSALSSRAFGPYCEQMIQETKEDDETFSICQANFFLHHCSSHPSRTPLLFSL